ncbi:hypothetical protein BDV93DRAFT_65592 [Ceratobasidium sp. AG-I]|nr:hypothetical protein BDV93DRAFT_65592 [Ceratobasidium sp. AG-I]
MRFGRSILSFSDDRAHMTPFDFSGLERSYQNEESKSAGRNREDAPLTHLTLVADHTTRIRHVALHSSISLDTFCVGVFWAGSGGCVFAHALAGTFGRVYAITGPYPARQQSVELPIDGVCCGTDAAVLVSTVCASDVRIRAASRRASCGVR